MVQKKDVSEKERNAKGKPDNSYLKWPWIILIILTVLLIGAFDYCSRTGNL